MVYEVVQVFLSWLAGYIGLTPSARQISQWTGNSGQVTAVDSGQVTAVGL